jgi:adenine-specific DNA-methyltransferase
MIEKPKMKTADLSQVNIEKLAELFPSVITEMKDENGELKRAVDFDLLKQALSDVLVEGEDERYRLDWPGKKLSLLKANTPIDKTLRPCREESVNFDTTENLYIEGDNFEVLKILQESYLGKIKMIYIDPPYNTGNDFIYKDDYKITKAEYEEELGTCDEEGARLFKNTDSNGRFHSDWLSMMYERLIVARDLLKDDGVIFISIDDNEVHNLRRICDDVFGEGNFVGQFSVSASPSGIDYGSIGKTLDFCLFYSKNINLLTTNEIPNHSKKFKYKDDLGPYNLAPLYNGNVAFNSKTRPNLYYPFYLDAKKIDEVGFYKISLEKSSNEDIEVWPVISSKDKIQRVWRWGKEKARINLNKEIIGYKNENNEYRICQKDRKDAKVIRDLLHESCYSTRSGTLEVEKVFNKKIFSFPKPIELIKKLVFLSTSFLGEDFILDLFAGSATTAHAVMALNAEDGGNRRCISVQISEKCDEESEAFKAGYKTIAEIGKERIRRAGKKILEEQKTKSMQLKLGEEARVDKELDIGFRVYKLDSSNMKDIYYHPNKIDQKQLSLFTNNIKEDRTPEDLLCQVILDLGLELHLRIESKNIYGNNVYFVETNSLVACFDEAIDFRIIDEIAQSKPLKVVFRDASFKNDKDRINLEERFKRLSAETIIKVI